MKGRRVTQEQFMERMEASTLRDAYGNPYNFSKAIYKGNKTKVTVICKIHGEFKTTPNILKRGHGCPKCGASRSAEKRSAESKATFKTRASKIHDNKYDYSPSIYLNTMKKLEIICPTHGSFWQMPNDHLNGHGCCDCRNEAHTGSNHPNWIEDRSLVSPTRVTGIKTWAREVKRGVTHCDFCKKEIDMGIRKNKIAHHLNAYASYPEQRLDVENGVVMDKECHKLVHRICGSGGNTAKGYYELRELYRVLNKI